MRIWELQILWKNESMICKIWYTLLTDMKDGVICGLCCRFYCGNGELASYNFCHWVSLPWRWAWQDQSLLPEACQEAVRLKIAIKTLKRRGHDSCSTTAPWIPFSISKFPYINYVVVAVVGMISLSLQW